MIIEKHGHHKRCVMNSTIIICVLLCMIFVIQLFFFLCYCSNNEKYRSVLCFDRCCTRCWSMCCYQSHWLWFPWYALICHLFVYPSRHWTKSLWDSWLLLCWWSFSLLLLSWCWSGEHNKSSHCSWLSLWCWLCRWSLHHHQPLFRYFLPCYSWCIPIELESFVYRKVCEERLRVIIQWNSLLILIWFICSSTALQIPRFIVLMKYAFIILADV